RVTEIAAKPLQTVSTPPEALAGDSDGVHHMGVVEFLDHVESGASKFTMQKGEIKPYVMPNDNRAAHHRENFRHPIAKRGPTGHHLLRNAGQCCNAATDPSLWIDELFVLGNDLPAFNASNADLDHPIAKLSAGAGRLGIDDRDRDFA